MFQKEEYWRQEDWIIEERPQTMLAFKVQGIIGFASKTMATKSLQIGTEPLGLKLREQSEKICKKRVQEIHFKKLIDMVNTIKKQNSEFFSRKLIQLTKKQRKKSQSFSRQKSSTSKITKKPEQKMKRRHQSQEIQNKKVKFNFYRMIKTDQGQYIFFHDTFALQIADIYGEGVIVTSNSKIIEGNFYEGNAIGSVNMIYENKALYQGPLYDGLPHGNGEMHYPNGQSYKGEFCYGDSHGKGKYYNKLGLIKKQGKWKRGTFIQ